MEYLGFVGEQVQLEMAEISKALEALAGKLGANAVVGLMIHPITEVSGTRFAHLLIHIGVMPMAQPCA